MSVLKWEAKAIEFAAKMYSVWLEATPEEMAVWRPEPRGDSKPRTMLEFTAECVSVNYGIAARLGEGIPMGPRTDPTFSSTREAAEALRASARHLADTLRSCDESILAVKVAMPWGEETGAFLVSLASRHMMYHGGQVNYIQSLYGDTEFRVPDRS